MGFFDSLAFTPPPMSAGARRDHLPLSRKEHRPFAEGIIRVRRLPEEWSPEEYRYWWLPETDERGLVVRPARIPEREKDARYTEAVFENLVTYNGKTQVLTYIGASGGNTTGFSKYIALGTGGITAPNPSDTVLVNETFRKVQASYSVQGTQVDVSFSLLSGDANASLTECGLYGGSATGTRNSGTLMTHALFSYTKGSWPVSIDYIIVLL